MTLYTKLTVDILESGGVAIKFRCNSGKFYETRDCTRHEVLCDFCVYKQAVEAASLHDLTGNGVTTGHYLVDVHGGWL